MQGDSAEIDAATPDKMLPEQQRTWPYMWSAFGLFFLLAFAFASWLPRLPELKSKFNLSDGDVGLVLVALPVGLLTIIPVVGYASTRLSLRSLNLICMTWMYISIPLVGIATGPLGLAAVICAIGMGAGAMGVAVNAAGFAAETKIGRPILSRCHAMYSVGLAAGGLIAGWIAAQGITIFTHLAATNLVLFILLLIVLRNVADDTNKSDAEAEPKLALPRGKLFVPGLIAMGCLMAEGVTVDWSSIFLADVLNAPAIYIGAGVAAFSAAMATMRFAGDALVSRISEHVIIGLGALISAIGFVTASIAPNLNIALIAFVIIGLGLAPIVPIAFRIAGKLSPNAPGVGVAAVSTLGYAGFLIGPALVGLIAEVTSLRASFATIAGLMVCVAVLSRRLKQINATSEPPTNQDL
ncbi:MAG: MFS transporter [Pseudomonadota bacterium]